MHHAKSPLLRLATPVLALVISACASPPAPMPSNRAKEQPPGNEDNHAGPVTAEPPDAPRKPTRPNPEHCAWSDVRGIAKLLARTGLSGTWQFFPGDDVLFHAVPAGARPEDEFKALLRRPMSGPCPTARLILFDPV